jgi:5-methylcytosine-specific restriction protein A
MNWKREEVILACDLVVRNGGRSLDHEDPRVVELSELLRGTTFYPLEGRLETFRNPNGVAQKTRNVAQHLAGYTGSGSHGSGLDGEVADAFAGQADVLHATAEAIRKKIAAGEKLDSPHVVLQDITREAVLAAIAEYGRLGQDHFLSQYGFRPAHQYLLVHKGKFYDSKAIVGVAHGFLPGRRPLAAGDFSGGEATVGRLVRRLGFTVSVSSEMTSSDLVARISQLQVRWADGLPALYQPITLLWAFGRALRGEPRIADWKTTRLQVGDLLARYGTRGERQRPDYPVAALYRAALWELEVGADPVPTAHGDAQLERWFRDHAPVGGLVAPVYELIRDWPDARVAAVREIIGTYFQGTDYVELLEDVGLSDAGITAETGQDDDTLIGRSPLEDAYRRLCGLADRTRARNDGKRASITFDRLVRSAAARRAVLLRSEGNCENPECTGQAADITDTGDPILEIDHIHDLAKGGPDDPGQMIALCPNCHAMKTRGRTRERLRQTLLTAARQRHVAVLNWEHGD